MNPGQSCSIVLIYDNKTLSAAHAGRSFHKRMDADFSLLHLSFESMFLSQHEQYLDSPFRLLDLPPELWLKVLDFAVRRPNTIRIGRESKFSDQVARVRQPAVTRTCRLLRREGLPMFYANNKFEMVHSYDVPCPRRWLEVIGKERRRWMRELVIDSRCSVEFWRYVNDHHPEG